MGKPVDNIVHIPTRTSEDIQLGFEVVPLNSGLNVVNPNAEYHLSRLQTLVPILPPPPVVFVQEPAEPEPEPVSSILLKLHFL